jgi:hypothetical protein
MLVNLPKFDPDGNTPMLGRVNGQGLVDLV